MMLLRSGVRCQRAREPESLPYSVTAAVDAALLLPSLPWFPCSFLGNERVSRAQIGRNILGTVKANTVLSPPGLIAALPIGLWRSRRFYLIGRTLPPLDVGA